MRGFWQRGGCLCPPRPPALRASLFHNFSCVIFSAHFLPCICVMHYPSSVLFLCHPFIFFADPCFPSARLSLLPTAAPLFLASFFGSAPAFLSSFSFCIFSPLPPFSLVPPLRVMPTVISLPSFTPGPLVRHGAPMPSYFTSFTLLRLFHLFEFLRCVLDFAVLSLLCLPCSHDSRFCS